MNRKGKILLTIAASVALVPIGLFITMGLLYAGYGALWLITLSRVSKWLGQASAQTESMLGLCSVALWSIIYAFMVRAAAREIWVPK